MQTTIQEKEILFFKNLSGSWWDEKGPFKMLHRMNPLRLSFLKNHVDKHFKDISPDHLHFLDVGCGGGILTEPLARQGFQVTGIDATLENIEVAKHHGAMMSLSIQYKNLPIEALAQESPQFHLISALEIIEHVADVPLFLESCVKALRPGGLLFISTLNRTPLSFLGAIVGAEYLLRWAPRGTHHWQQFIKPSELVNLLEKLNMELVDLKGMELKPLTREWVLGDRLNINYIGCFQKR